MSILMRRGEGTEAEEQLENLPYNIRAEVRLHTCRSEQHTAIDLTQHAEENKTTLNEAEFKTKTAPKLTAVVEPLVPSKDCYIYQRTPDTRYFVPVTIAGRQLSALVDSGSVNSFVSEETARWCLRNGWQQQEFLYFVALPDSSEKPLKASIEGKIEILGLERTVMFQVIDTLSHYVLLGMDILDSLDLKIYLGDRQLKDRFSDCSAAGTPEPPLIHNTLPQSTAVVSEHPPPSTHIQLPSVLQHDSIASLPRRKVILPEGQVVEVPIGVKKYVVRYGPYKQLLHLHPETGQVRYVGPARLVTAS